jgi:vitamin B12 transporter
VQDPENRDSGATLLRRAKRKGALAVDRSFGGGWQAGVEALAFGSRSDAGFPVNVDLGGYALVNARAAWTPAPQWSIELRADNLADRDYTQVFGFNTPGRSFHLGLRWQTP